eukprot:3641533-Pyramimonas_sp.AAC.1
MPHGAIWDIGSRPVGYRCGAVGRNFELSRRRFARVGYRLVARWTPEHRLAPRAQNRKAHMMVDALVFPRLL